MNPPWNTPSAIWATTDLVWLGSGWALDARKLIPRNIEIATAPMIPRVAAAFRACGRRKAGTPFEMASTPVSAVDPDENAWRMTKRLAPAAAPARMWSAGTTAWGQPPVAHLTRAVITKAKIERMNPYVGAAKTVPDSRTPRRFAKVIRT